MATPLKNEQKETLQIPVEEPPGTQREAPGESHPRSVLSSRWATSAIAAIILALPFGNVQVPGLGVDAALPAVAAGSVLAGLLQIAARRQLAIPSGVLIASGSTIIVGAVSALASSDTATTLTGFLVSAVGFFLAIMTASVCYKTGHSTAILALLLVVGSGMCLYALTAVGSLQAQFGGAVVTGRATGVFAQPNELGCFAAIIVVSGVGTMFLRTRWMLTLGVIAALCAAPALILSFSRGAWIGTLAGLGLLILVLPNARRRVLPKLIAAAVFVTGVALLDILPVGLAEGPLGTVGERITSVFNPTNNPYDARPAIWAEAVQQIKEDPLLGHGPGTFKEVATAASYNSPAVDADHAHNFMLTVGAETGLLGIATLVIAIITGVVTIIFCARSRGWGATQEPLTYAAGLSVVLAQGYVDYPLPNPVLATTTWLIIGLLAGTTARKRDYFRTSNSESAPSAGLGVKS